MTKPTGPACNLDCAYCFYLEKENLYADPVRFRMDDTVLESYVRQYIETQATPEIHFAWQGGEPTLLGIGFFQKALELQRRYAEGKIIHNSIQTNGTRLDDRWGEFLARNKFLAGISLDGPQDLHDIYRRDRQGKPTFDRVMRGLSFLQKHGVDYNTLTVVHRRNAKHALEVYEFLRTAGSTFLQFIPLVERLAPEGSPYQLAGPPSPDGTEQSAPVTEWSVRPADYGQFLCEIFDRWVIRDVGKIFVQIFDTTLANWMGGGGTTCVFSENCGSAMALEHNGDLYSCDHFVYPEHRLGNLLSEPLGDMAASAKQRDFGRAKSASLPRYCRDCDVRFACHGECPKHRFLQTPDGEPGLNYLCPSYKKFFAHTAPAMRKMATLLHHGRAPAEIMRPESPATPPKIGLQKSGRNDPCPCGSGKKYKHCCLPNGGGQKTPYKLGAYSHA